MMEEAAKEAQNAILAGVADAMEEQLSSAKVDFEDLLDPAGDISELPIDVG